jgi:hypothetical protein
MFKKDLAQAVPLQAEQQGAGAHKGHRENKIIEPLPKLTRI